MNAKGKLEYSDRHSSSVSAERRISFRHWSGMGATFCGEHAERPQAVRLLGWGELPTTSTKLLQINNHEVASNGNILFCILFWRTVHIRYSTHPCSFTRGHLESRFSTTFWFRSSWSSLAMDRRARSEWVHSSSSLRVNSFYFHTEFRKQHSSFLLHPFLRLFNRLVRVPLRSSLAVPHWQYLLRVGIGSRWPERRTVSGTIWEEMWEGERKTRTAFSTSMFVQMLRFHSDIDSLFDFTHLCAFLLL